ncbi:hypothetical protein H6G49_12125 [Nostoc sp. PCC 7120 = FACHB-418]|uniref:hypothetical protein n=1 Tax=Nostoc sp. (strain PCC 7120 / SAG 25.82 / UTEX 2576) TaxID=103690 RepID=UPI00000CDDD4|nr:hypothetical protein [Nostoc sp. PCC 7120 = FACHB-418]MBD2264109.1 hypothetical protein [Anabaena sp. FACHB-709]MBD2350176.1 hypothetical protein [Trichormus variabilis FACHB-171]HBW31083.1 hypothetical protein [Nostoc sp. UBA8866]MBD2273363.1 hypothetical protein [Nostoc sp. PCC 7120 = FACHB-418]BAB72553.1 asl0595 [Nostoc sp. PCC 7120 = FACHB-418]
MRHCVHPILLSLPLYKIIIILNIQWKPSDRPHMVGLIYYAFRVMIAIGFFLAGLMLVSTLFFEVR